MSKSYLFIAGEISSDLYAAAIAKALKQEEPLCEIHAIGGDQLQACADKFLFKLAHLNRVSIKEDFFSADHIKVCQHHIKIHLEENKVDRVIICDFPHHNARIAKAIKPFKLPISTFITPHFWIWGNKRKAKQLIDYSDQIITIFPNENQFYQELTDKSVFLGHPMVTKAMITKPHGPIKSDIQHLTMCPGSREQELDLYFDKMVQTVTILQTKYPELICEISAASKEFESKIRSRLNIIKPKNIKKFHGDKADLFQKTDGVITATGTQTLEILTTKKPMIICAGLPKWSYWYLSTVYRKKLAIVALPNIVAKQVLIPEFLQDRMIPEKMAQKLEAIVTTTEKTALLNNYEKILTLLYRSDAVSLQIAQYIMKGV